MVELIHGLTRGHGPRESRAAVNERLAAAGREPGEVADPRRRQVPARSSELDALAAGGVTLAGENRAQELVEKAAAHPEFTWDFIGALQSRKVPLILPHVRYIHSVASDSALAQLAKHGDAETRDPGRGQRRRRSGQGGRDPG